MLSDVPSFHNTDEKLPSTLNVLSASRRSAVLIQVKMRTVDSTMKVRMLPMATTMSTHNARRLVLVLAISLPLEFMNQALGIISI
jgi:hypothetical protein